MFLWSEMLCARLYVPPICASMNPNVEFIVFVQRAKFYEILIMLVIKYLQGSDTNLEFNLVVKTLLVVRTCVQTICNIYIIKYVQIKSIKKKTHDNSQNR